MPVQFCPSAAAGRRERDGSCSWTVVGLTATPSSFWIPIPNPNPRWPSTQRSGDSHHLMWRRSEHYPDTFVIQVHLIASVQGQRWPVWALKAVRGYRWHHARLAVRGCALVTNERPGSGLRLRWWDGPGWGTALRCPFVIQPAATEAHAHEQERQQADCLLCLWSHRHRRLTGSQQVRRCPQKKLIIKQCLESGLDLSMCIYLSLRFCSVTSVSEEIKV